MMGQSGYTWMMGGTAAPGWMTGGSLPESMMGGSGDPGTVMGSLFANAPGPRVSGSDATRLGSEVPAGATIDSAARRITFSGQAVSFTVLASPSMPQEDFEIAGMVDPTVVVPSGARISIQLINADTDMAHGLVVTAGGASSSSMPMMTAPPAFSGAALWFLGDATSAGMHTATLSFAATTAGTYQYICPVPAHAQEGMAGNFVVQAGP
jgi:rusticyanin